MRKVSLPIYFWFPVLGCVAFGTFFMNIPPVADQFMALFGVGYAGLSFLFSANYWTHIIFLVPGGLFVDRVGVARSLLLCLAVLIATNLAPFLAPDSLALAVAMRLVLGVVTGAAFLVMVKIIKILTPPNHVARMQGMHGAAFCLGTMLPYLYLPLAGPYGWAVAYLSGAVFCAALGLCMFRLPLDRLREKRETASPVQIWQAMKSISLSKPIWLIGCCHGFFFGTINTLGNWLPSILADTSANSTAEDWALATGVLLLIGTLARVFSSEVMGHTSHWKLVTRTLFVVGVSYFALAFLASPVALFCLCVGMAVLSGFTFATIFTLLFDVSPMTYLATAVGFMNMIANGINLVLIIIWGNAREFSGGFGVGLCITGVCALGIWL